MNAQAAVGFRCRPWSTFPGGPGQTSGGRKATPLARNVEIKARLTAGHAERARQVALARSTATPEDIHQTDTFFNVPDGRLKMRVFGDGRAELIAYQRPDHAGPRLSSYVRAPCADAASTLAALGAALGVRGVVEKRRVVVHVGQSRLHFDEVAGLGRFLEIEVVLREDQLPAEGERIARDLMEMLGIEAVDLIEDAYIDLLAGARQS